MFEVGSGQRDCASEHELNDSVSELGSGSEAAHVTAGHESSLFLHATADERSGVRGFLEVPESGPGGGVRSGRAITVSVSEGNAGLLEVTESDFPSLNSSVLGSLSSACARHVARSAATASARVCLGSSSLAVSAAVAHAHASILHDARHNSWSDTGSLQGPRGRKRVKGGVSGPAEDLRPVSEVAAGVNFRPAGGVRGQLAGPLPRRQPGTGTRRQMVGVATSSLHPEVPGIQFVSPGYGLDIRQSMGWTKVCETARSGIWVLKGNSRTCMFPANLDHLRPRGSYETACVTPGHDCLCLYKYGDGAAVRPQTSDALVRAQAKLPREVPAGQSSRRGWCVAASPG